MDRRKERCRHLDPPAAFRAPRQAEGLIPPSHFQSRSAPPLVAQPTVPLDVTVLSNWETDELKRENQRLKDELHRWTTKREAEEADIRNRSQDRKAENSSAHHTLAMSQQAEVISHQLHEIQRLEAELATLRVASAQQELAVASRETAVSHLQHELMELKTQSQAETASLKTELEEVRRRSKLEKEDLKEELELLRKQSQLEAETLKEELELTKKRHHCEMGTVQGQLQRVREEAETEQKRKEEKMQEQLQAVLREHQTELARRSEVHGAEVATLKHDMQVFQQDVEAQHKDAEQLRVKKNALQKQLSAAEAELASQNALLQQLKIYIGEQESRQPSADQEQLINRMQQLEDENEALKVTAELLQVRLASVNDILALQEMELTKKVQLHDPLQPEATQKFQCLLTRWREKVFSLLVQLKSQELSHRDATKLLERKIKELEESVETREQKVVLLLHSLEDKTAEVNMERVRNKTLQVEALRSNELAQNLQQRAEADKNALQGLGDFINSLKQQLMGKEEAWKAALSRLVSLGNRITFAAKRVDTIQGLVCQKIALAKLLPEEKLCTRKSEEEKIQPLFEDLQVELNMLHEERNKLTMELKRGAQLVEKKVAEAKEQAESELKEMRETLQSLQEALTAKAVIEESLRQQQEATERQLESASINLTKNEEAAESLRQELKELREEYERALQEKVTEIETELRKDLSEMEKGLNEARREHTKAVVALRQAERQAARDKTRSEELAKLQESATQQEIARLEGRLQELERDKNLLMVTLRQEGLLAQHRQNRSAAIQASAGAAEKAATELSSKESLFAVLDDLQILGAAIMGEEEEGIVDKERHANADT